MSASEKFLRFADECEVVASIARDRESRLMWQSFAARWSRHAQSVDTRLARRVVRMERRHRRLTVEPSSDGEALAH
jgi:hypothetical protein